MVVCFCHSWPSWLCNTSILVEFELRIYIGMNGVLVKLVDYWLERYNNDFNEGITANDITDFDITKFVKQKGIIRQYLLEPGFFGPKRESHPDAAEVMRMVCDENPNVFILTSPVASETCERDKRWWVEQHLPFFDTKKIIFSHHKYLLSKSGDVLLDDKPENLRKWRDNGGISVCFRRPWNCPNDGTFSVASWQDFYWQLGRIKEGSAYLEGG